MRRLLSGLSRTRDLRHISAISWLNESSSASFYLLKLETVRIGDSPPALLLTLIVGPSDVIQKAGEEKKERTERDSLRHRFWTALLERAKDRTLLHVNTSPNQAREIRATAGKRGLTFGYVIQRHTSEIELYIDKGRDAGSENEEIFNVLEKAKDGIEEAFGKPLEWQRLEGQRSCRIGKQLSHGGYRDDEERWPEIQDAMIDAMIRLEAAFRTHIDRLPA